MQFISGVRYHIGVHIYRIYDTPSILKIPKMSDDDFMVFLSFLFCTFNRLKSFTFYLFNTYSVNSIKMDDNDEEEDFEFEYEDDDDTNEESHIDLENKYYTAKGIFL